MTEIAHKPYNGSKKTRFFQYLYKKINTIKSLLSEEKENSSSSAQLQFFSFNKPNKKKALTVLFEKLDILKSQGSFELYTLFFIPLLKFHLDK